MFFLVNTTSNNIPSVERELNSTGRSDYVHSSDDIFPEYDKNFQEGETIQKIYIVRCAIIRLQIDASRWIKLSETRNKPPARPPLTEKEREKS